jgi:PmbA protein
MEKASELLSAMDTSIPCHGSAVFLPSAASTLLRHGASFFCADRTESSSILGALGKSFFSPSITLIDDGLSNQTPFGGLADLEGCAPQKTTLVEKGVARLLLLDSREAARLNRRSTSNRMWPDTKNWPCITPRRLYIANGQHTRSQLIDNLPEDSFLIHSITSVSQNPEYPEIIRATALGWKVSSQGLIPLGNITLSASLLGFFRDALATASDLEFFGNFGSPSIFIEKMPLE